MKFLKPNIYVTILGLVFLTFLGYQAIENDSCVEITPKGFQVGICES